MALSHANASSVFLPLLPQPKNIQAQLHRIVWPPRLMSARLARSGNLTSAPQLLALTKGSNALHRRGFEKRPASLGSTNGDRVPGPSVEGEAGSAAAVAEAVGALKAAFSGLSFDAFSALTGDLKAELKDAGFALGSGPVLLELGDDLGTVLLELGGGMEEAKASRTLGAAARLSARLETGAQGLGVSERAALGRRLQASGRFLAGMGTGAPREIVQLGSAMVALGEQLTKAGREQPVDAAAVYGRKSFKVGSWEFEVSPTQASLGSLIAGLFSISTWRGALVFDVLGEDAGGYTTGRAALVAFSLKQSLLLVAYGTAALSMVACFGLAALAIQVSSQSDQSE